MTETTDLGAAALDLARAGYAVFPIAPRAKKPPLTPHGLHDATHDEQTIRAWWARDPDANIAIATGATSGIYVIDIDEDHNGHNTLAALERDHEPLAPTRAAATGNGSHHLYQHPGFELPNTAGRLGPGIDTRGDGGYIIAPPSWHPTGVRYEWLNDLDLAPLPDWVVSALTSGRVERPITADKPISSDECPTPPISSGSITAYAAKALSERAREVRDAPAGQRNDTLNRAACRLGELIAGGQIDEHQVVDELTNAATACGLAGGEIAATIASGLRAGKTRPQYPDPARTRTSSRATSAPAPPAAASNGATGAPPPRSIDPDDAPALDEWQRGIKNTDIGNAIRLLEQHGHELRYATHRAGWLRWNGTHWTVDDGYIGRCAHSVAQHIWDEARQLEGDAQKERRTWAAKSENAPKLEAMVRRAAFLAEIRVDADQLDADPWLLNVTNGTLNLRTGQLRPHDQRDLITKIAPVHYDPEARDDRWDAYVTEAMGGDTDLIDFLQRAVGYTLTGDTSEEVLFFAHGPTETGKSTFLEAVKATLGDYTRSSDFETFLARDQGGTARPDIARLAGARLVTSSEVDDGKRFAEGLVKTLTGGDTITARYLYRDEFEYRPQFKLWLAANRKPQANHGDGAIWRRIRLVPFVHPPAHRDPTLKHHLATDAGARAAILTWAVEGCRRWQRDGLRTPDAVRAATEAYRQEQDPLGEFLEDHAVFESGGWCRAGDLREAYEAWAKEAGLRRTLSPRAFRELLEARGATSDRRRVDGKTARVWDGVRLATATDLRPLRLLDHAASTEEPARDARDASDGTPESFHTRGYVEKEAETQSQTSRASRSFEELMEEPF